MEFFKAFNSLQITALFAGFPFGIAWLWTADFPAAGVAVWVAIVVYVIFFILMTASVCNSIGDE